jgi:hypothetical protein
LDTDWSYTLFFAFSAALAASFNKMFLRVTSRKSPALAELNVIVKLA